VSPSVHRYDGNYLDAPFPRLQNFSPAPLNRLTRQIRAVLTSVPARVRPTRPSSRPAVGCAPSSSFGDARPSGYRARPPTARHRTSSVGLRQRVAPTLPGSRPFDCRLEPPQRGVTSLRFAPLSRSVPAPRAPHAAPDPAPGSPSARPRRFAPRPALTLNPDSCLASSRLGFVKNCDSTLLHSLGRLALLPASRMQQRHVIDSPLAARAQESRPPPRMPSHRD